MYDEDVVVEVGAEEDKVPDLEGRDGGHAVVAAELDRADPPLIARRLAEKGLEQQREHEGEDRHNPALHPGIEDKVPENPCDDGASGKPSD
jgi:hypothetical protein